MLTLGFFNPVLTGGHFSTIPAHERVVYPWAGLPPTGLTEYPQSDQADLNHPWQALLTRSLDEGSVPFWDPNSYAGGYPFFANGSSAILYPPRLVAALVVDPVRAHDLFLIVHVFLSGLAMYALLRELQVGRPGSLLAAVSWMFAGFNMAWLHLEVVTPMSVFLPLDLLCVHRAHRDRSWTFTILSGLALGATLTSGHLILLGLVYLVAVAYMGALAVAGIYQAARSRRWGEAFSHALRGAATVAISAGSAMVVLLPTAHALSTSQRDPFTYGDLVRSFLAPARTLLYSAVPPPLPVTADRMHEMAFAGTATFVLALVGVLVRRRSGSWLGRGLLVTAFAIALGTPATWIAYHYIPGFDVFRPYSRLLVFSAFAIALLGGLGLDALWRHTREPADDSPSPRYLRVPGRRRAVVALSVVAIGLTTVQLGRYGRDVNPPYVPDGVDGFYQPTPLTRALANEIKRPNTWPGRVLPTRVTAPGERPGPPMLFAAESVVFDFDSAGGYDSVVPRRVTALVRALQGESYESVLARGLPSAYAPAFESASTRFDLLARLGITVLATNPMPALETSPTSGGALPPTEVVYEGPDGRLLRVTGASSSPYLVYDDAIVTSPSAAFRRFLDPGFDFTRAVVVERQDLRRGGLSSLAPATSGTGTVDAARRGVNTAHVTVTTTAPAWLVFHDSWAEGWSATIDGAPARVVRANYAKRAVQVPAGRSEVRLRYRPPGLAAGGGVTVLTLLGCGAALVFLRWGRRPRTGLRRRPARR